MKKIIIIAFLLLPLGVFAKGDWSLKENKNVLSVEGSCQESNVKIELYPENKGEAVYSSNIPCINNEFKFSDNLLQWNNLKNGEYEVLVNGNMDNIKKITIERPSQPISQPTKNEKKEKVEVVSSQDKFLKAFLSLQKSALEMRIWLNETEYPKIVKMSLGLGIDSVDLAIGKLSSLILSGEKGSAREADSLEIATEKNKTESTLSIEENKAEKLTDQTGIPVTEAKL